MRQPACRPASAHVPQRITEAAPLCRAGQYVRGLRFASHGTSAPHPSTPALRNYVSHGDYGALTGGLSRPPGLDVPSPDVVLSNLLPDPEVVLRQEPPEGLALSGSGRRGWTHRAIPRTQPAASCVWPDPEFTADPTPKKTPFVTKCHVGRIRRHQELCILGEGEDRVSRNNAALPRLERPLIGFLPASRPARAGKRTFGALLAASLLYACGDSGTVPAPPPPPAPAEVAAPRVTNQLPDLELTVRGPLAVVDFSQAISGVVSEWSATSSNTNVAVVSVGEGGRAEVALVSAGAAKITVTARNAGGVAETTFTVRVVPQGATAPPTVAGACSQSRSA